MATVKKAQSGIVAKFKKVGEDLKQADRNYKTSDSLRNVKPASSSLKGKLDEMKSNRSKADSLYKAGRKLEGLDEKDGYKSGGKMKKAKSGGSFPDLNKDGKVTKADILKGRGVIAKSGMKMAKKPVMKFGGKLAPNKSNVSKNVSNLNKAKSGAKMKRGC